MTDTVRRPCLRWLAGALAWLVASTASAQASPFVLTLADAQGLRVTATLRNRSAREQWLLVGDLQPTVPTLRDRSGAAVSLVDDRMTSKFDTTPHQYLFVRAAVNAAVPAGDGEFERLPDGAYAFHWGWFNAPRLGSGCYRLALRWNSRTRGWSDEQGRWQPQPDIWIGEVESKPRQICLP